MIKGVIDRIEDGSTAVVIIEGGGSMFIPVEQFDMEIHEGACLDIDLKLNPERENEYRKKIDDLQEDLINKNEDD